MKQKISTTIKLSTKDHTENIKHQQAFSKSTKTGAFHLTHNQTEIPLVQTHTRTPASASE